MTASANKIGYFSLPDDLDRLELLKRLTADHRFVLDPPQKKREEFFDTFDRRLHSANMVLIKEGGSYNLKTISDGTTVQSIKCEKNTAPKFWWDFPKCALRTQLKSHSSIRALLSLANIERSIATLRLLNNDKKTVLYVYIKDLQVPNSSKDKLAVVLQVKPLKGYDAECQTFIKYLDELGLRHTDGNILNAAAAVEGKYPLNYSSKINVVLKSEMKSADAAKLIFKNLLATMTVNEFGIKDDIDTEFLHDFRVAVRRTRSALSQIKYIFSPVDTEKFKALFSEVGKATNELRDLDVYLLTEEKYKKMLPDDLRAGLDPLFDKLAKQRGSAKAACAKFLGSKRYKEIIREWEEFLENQVSSPESAPNCERPILDVAKEHIWKKYSKVLKLGKRINDNTPDAELHDLRIECKKLRYLLEFFTSLFSEQDMKLIIKHLKVLQDNLGDFNDLYVQQESLKKFLSSEDIGYDQSKQKTLAAAGGLVSVLYQQQISVRKKFKENFNKFSDKETTALFEKSFSK